MWAHWDPLAVCVCVGGGGCGEGCVGGGVWERETHLTKFITGRALHT